MHTNIKKTSKYAKNGKETNKREKEKSGSRKLHFFLLHQGQLVNKNKLKKDKVLDKKSKKWVKR